MQLTTFKYFYPERPRLIHIEQPLFASLDVNPNWVAEPKKNGQRLVLHYINNQFQFWGRHADPLTYKPNEELSQALQALNLTGYWQFDAELRHNKTKGIQHQIMLFDVFVCQNTLLLEIPFWQRRELLEQQHLTEGISLSTQYRQTNLKELYYQLIQDEENEGLVLKNRYGVLNLGRTKGMDSAWMYKVRKTTGRHKF